MRLLRWIGLALLSLFVAVALFLLAAAETFSLSPNAVVSHHSFKDDQNTLGGSLILPADILSPPIALIVHGDGPQDRWSADGYYPIVNALLSDGIGVFTWDKPGIGASSGDWLDQSMADRTAEAIAAFAFLTDLNIDADRLGFLGFSQAGWVVPQAATQTDAAFVVLVGPAINWRTQGAYYTQQRLSAEGLAPELVAQRVAQNLAQNDARFRQESECDAPADMRVARCNFVARNYGADAQEGIDQLTVNALVMMGEKDQNVNPSTTAKGFADQPLAEVVIVPNATHGLLRAPTYNYQLVEDWPLLTQLRFALEGQSAFAPDALNTISKWIKSNSNAPR